MKTNILENSSSRGKASAMILFTSLLKLSFAKYSEKYN